MTLGQRIQALRKEKGLSQEALGEALGVSRQAVSQWEADASLPELDKLVGLSRLFGLPLGDLLQLEEPAPQAAPAEDPARLQKRRLAHGLSAAAALLLAAARVWTGTGLVRTSERLAQAEARLTALEAAAAAPRLDPAAPLVATFDFEATRYGNDVNFALSLTAAQQAEGMTVTFQATRASDAAVNTVSKAAALSPGSSTGYSTVLHVPDCFGSVTTLTAVFELDGQRCTQALARNVSVGENSASWEPLWQAQG